MTDGLRAGPALHFRSREELAALGLVDLGTALEGTTLRVVAVGPETITVRADPRPPWPLPPKAQALLDLVRLAGGRARPYRSRR